MSTALVLFAEGCNLLQDKRFYRGQLDGVGEYRNAPAAIAHIQIKVDNAQRAVVCARSSQRIVEFVDHTRKIVQLLYQPPYHSKYNPIERCWGILEQHWNGAKLVFVETMLE